MWFELGGDARLGRCASDGCGGQPTWRLEARGTGSVYCSGCKAKLEAQFRTSAEYDLMARIASAATDVVNECESRFDLVPSLGAMAKLADAVHAHWKFQRGN